MKYSTKLMYLIVFSLLGLLISSASLALAYSSQTSECGGCHSTTNVLTLSSDASGTINAVDGTPFSLEVYAGGYTGGDLSFYVVVESSWADNNQFSFTSVRVQDNSGDDLNANVDQITVSITFTPLSVGSHTIRIWTASSGDLSKSLDVGVSVTVDDSDSPTIDTPGDIQISEGDPSANVTWDPYDANPSRYEVLDTGAGWLSGSWDGSDIVVVLDTLTLGDHTLTITVYDINENSVSDQVDVSVVDDSPPYITPISNYAISEGAPHTLTWTISELHPHQFEVLEDSISIDSGVWDGNDISVVLNGLDLATYNYTLIVTDTNNNKATHSVLVTVVDGTNPMIPSESDIAYPEGYSGESITWTPSDLHPISYQVWKNGTPVFSGSWNITGESITVFVDGLSVALHNYTLVVTDIGGNIGKDEVFVTVFSAIIPYVDHPIDQSISEGSINNNITWNPLDLNPLGYIIYRNSQIITSGPWNSSSETISVPLEGLNLGQYNFTLYIYDDEANSAVDTVWITIIDTTSPTIDSPADISFKERTSEYNIVWNLTDLNPLKYEIYKNSVRLQQEYWNSLFEIVTISVEDLSYGVYNYTIIVFDSSNNTKTDEVVVTVLDGIEPIIFGSSDFEYEETTIGHSITWDVSDAHPISYFILRNGTPITSGTWNGSSISLTVDWLVQGVYNYTLIVIDEGNNWAIDSVIVTVIEHRIIVSSPTTTDSPSTVPEPPDSLGNTQIVIPFAFAWVVGFIFILKHLDKITDQKNKGL